MDEMVEEEALAAPVVVETDKLAAIVASPSESVITGIVETITAPQLESGLTESISGSNLLAQDNSSKRNSNKRLAARKSNDFDDNNNKRPKGGDDKRNVTRNNQINNPIIIPSVALSSRDKAAQIVVSKDQMTCYGEGGYRMIRGTHGVHSGAYFWEAEIKETLDTNAHVRIGWSTRQGELQAPVGFDKYSFGYRDIGGSKVHNSTRDDNYGESFGPGDIIGCFIYLDDTDANNNQMRFFKNGKDQGVAYKGKDIPTSVYFPAISLYLKSEVSVNFGPSFILKHDIYGANAVSEVQPMSPEDRREHENRIAAIREARGFVKT